MSLQSTFVRPSVIAVALAGSLAFTGSPVAHAEQIVLESGHLNAFNVTAKNGQLKLDIKEDITAPNVERPAEDVTLVVHKDAYTDATKQLPQVGKSGYVLPQGYHQGMLRPGWTTLMARWDGFTDVKIRIDEVTGPGEVYMFNTDGKGGFKAAAEDGNFQLTPGSAIHQETPAHLHTHWLFTEPGTYTMKVTALSNGKESNQATYTWQVGQKAHPRPIMDEPLSLERMQTLANAGKPVPPAVDPVEKGAVPPAADAAAKDAANAPAKNAADAVAKNAAAEAGQQSAAPADGSASRPAAVAGEELSAKPENRDELSAQPSEQGGLSAESSSAERGAGSADLSAAAESKPALAGLAIVLAILGAGLTFLQSGALKGIVLPKL
ncbi:choice-of-anchor M domain-containing protein [Corynebacterium glaucum]|uniref:choice-of-anchor M domain-containing protein n=1 Tax=Corynebacterium glaucum TaxID=187491 RepID=UPI002657DE90|nr:choice-of-anchor M domain-containing protein [Corynebacterium glaucum]